VLVPPLTLPVLEPAVLVELVLELVEAVGVQPLCSW
jgi:hypothetical protein